MSEENSNKEFKIYSEDVIFYDSQQNYKLTIPLEMEWQPKEDITTYELALCMQYLVRHRAVMPYEVDMELTHFRHFKITDHNTKER